mgnify:CR=1 FL=1
MDTRIAAAVLAISIGLVFIQGLLSWYDGYLTQGQMRASGINNGWAFVEHGGMWGDAFFISPILAYLLGTYQIAYVSTVGLVTFAIIAAGGLAAGCWHRDRGITEPEAHTHDGRTTKAGYIHALFAVFAIWTITLAYLNQMTPPIRVSEVGVISCILTPFFFIGVTKFSKRWSLKSDARRQVAIQLIILWGVTVFHGWRFIFALSAR